MMRTSSPFKWRHHAPDVILLCLRWYGRYQLSYRDLEEMMRERGLSGLDGRDAAGQARCVESLFRFAA